MLLVTDWRVNSLERYFKIWFYITDASKNWLYIMFYETNNTILFQT